MAIILSFTPANETMVFVIVVALFLMIPIFGEPMSNSEFEKKYGKPVESSNNNTDNNYLSDPQYSILPGNIFHSDS